MMTADEALPLISIDDFSGSKQTTFFKLLKHPQLTGELLLSDSKGQTWSFYIYLGRITYATGGVHSFRSWKRNVLLCCPQITPDFSVLLKEAIKEIAHQSASTCWQLRVLNLWTTQQKITREQATKVIRAILVEVLFDVTQARQVTYRIKQDQSLNTQLALIDAEQIAGEVQELWKVWQAAKIADRSPNSAPVIRQPKALQENTSANLYQVLTKMLDGQRTLRDLAIQMKRDVVEVTRSLSPYVQRGFIEFVEIPDYPAPIQPPVAAPTAVSPVQGPLIACIDDSPLICQSMEEVIKGAKYQFLGINDPLRAIALLMSRKPALIFLDLIMPNANGYEICSQLRKLGIFKDTPIVILSGQDGLVDRVRAKLVGASDFLSKPADPTIVLGMIRKYLHQSVDA